MVSERDKARPDQDDTRERAIFAACLDLPTEAREPHLERACNGDARLKSRLRRLLAVHRAVAEVENIKRRAETQNNDARAYAIQRFARDLLGVADNLERALQAAPSEAIRELLRRRLQP